MNPSRKMHLRGILIAIAILSPFSDRCFPVTFCELLLDMYHSTGQILPCILWYVLPKFSNSLFYNTWVWFLLTLKHISAYHRSNMFFSLVINSSRAGHYSSVEAQANTSGPNHVIVPAVKIWAKSTEFYIISQQNMWIIVNFHVQVNAVNCHSKFEVDSVMAQQLFKALKTIDT